jgi:ketosteroid isomerase-like protein
MSQSAPDAPPRARLRDTLERFVAAFNADDLDAAMAFFAEGAIYCPGDGREHRGKAAIRAAFAPQFNGVYGEMRFDVDDWLLDEAAGKAAIRWVCRHDLSGEKARRIPAPRRWLYRLAYGPRAGWYGTDIFHLDAEGKISGKFSYANAFLPQLRRDLGR